MSNRPTPLLALLVVACQSAAEPIIPATGAVPDEVLSSASALHRVAFPSEDPGPPIYARLTPLLNQIFRHGELVAIPFYRETSCIPLDADLLAYFHPPGPEGPGAFGCPLTIKGTFLIERNAPPGTFPIRANSTGNPEIWFVAWRDLQPAIAKGHLTMGELVALSPLRGTAQSYQEMLAPRMDAHHVVINSHGRLEDGRSFRFAVNHQDDETRSIMIRLR